MTKNNNLKKKTKIMEENIRKYHYLIESKKINKYKKKLFIILSVISIITIISFIIFFKLKY